MRQKVLQFMKQHQLLKKDTTVLVGVSGGPDSMALLHLYKSFSKAWNIRLIALSIDHQLRGEDSIADVAYVRAICADWDIPFEAGTLDVPAYHKMYKVSTQVAARTLRYQFFLEKMQEYAADYLALGHHGDDQVETILMNLTRSSNPAALAGIPVKRSFADGEIVRPLLCVERKEIEEYCAAHQIIPRLDASNEEVTYTRNYFRKYILPLLKEKNERIHVTTQRLSEALQEDESFLEAEAKKAAEKVISEKIKGEKVTIGSMELKSFPRALQRRIYHLILSYLYKKTPKTLSSAHEASFLDLLTKSGYRQLDFPHGLKIEKSYDLIRFSFKNSMQEENAFQQKLLIPTDITLPDGATLQVKYVNEIDKLGKHIIYIHPEDVSLPLQVRFRQTGDAMSWKGLNGSRKLKDIFIDEKIPLKERDNWPIITDDSDEIIWLVGIKKGKKAIEQQDKRTLFVQLRYEQAACRRKNDA